MENFILVWFATALICMVADHKVEEKLKAAQRPKALKWWSIFLMILWAGASWIILSAMTSSVLRDFFSDQPSTLEYQRNITFYPALIWGLVCLWVLADIPASLKNEEIERYSPEVRIERLFTAVFKATGCLILILLALTALLIIYFITDSAGESIVKMPPSSAIIVGALIIAFAISSRRG